MPTESPKIEERAAVVVCGGLAGFSELTSTLGPVQLVDVLKHYRDLVWSTLENAGAELLFYVGDIWLACWALPQAEEEKAKIGAALAAVLTGVFRQQLQSGAKVKLHMGVAAGKIVRADLGCEKRPGAVEYLGETVNFARRLQSGCSLFQRNILFPENLPIIWPKAMQVEKVKNILTKGAAENVAVYTLKTFGK